MSYRCDVEEGAHFRVDDAVPHERVHSQLPGLQLDPTDQNSGQILRNRESVVELIKARIALLRLA